MATLKGEWNPNRFKATDFNVYVGNTVNEVEKFSKKDEINKIALEFTQKMNWYKGQKKMSN